MGRISSIAVLFVASAAAFAAAPPQWLDLVGPIMSPAEKKAWLATNAAERPKFEESFWADKAITSEEYFKRLEYADATWGGPVRGSGLNTDQGRIYVGLGGPNHVSRFPSSRIFVPIEIWYYDSVPGVLNTELRLVFFQPNNVGFLRLYSPTVDTLRALLLNESGTRTMFNQNDILDENTIRQNLNVPPAEDEIISASVNVATGIKYSGNEEILGMVVSPREMLSRAPKTSVETRFIVDRPKLELLVTSSRFGAAQVDLSSDIKVKREVTVEVLEGQASVYRTVLRFNNQATRTVQYIHRLDLLPGSYRLLIGVDGQTFPYALDVPAKVTMSEILRATPAHASSSAPFEFDGYRLYPDSDGRYAVVGLSHPGEVQWLIRQGGTVLWRQKTTGDEAAILPLPYDRLPPGHYRLEVEAGDESKVLELDLTPRNGQSAGPSLLSYNANLSTAVRYAQVGHQWLLRGKTAVAATNLNAALDAAPIESAMIDLARIDTLAGNFDEARRRVQTILAADPTSFDALCVYAAVEVGFDDYRAAAQLYQRALAVEDSPAVRLALSRLPKQ
jgi:GWxTD domain-containing protein